jgi:hypothetical protein
MIFLFRKTPRKNDLLTDESTSCIDFAVVRASSNDLCSSSEWHNTRECHRGAPNIYKLAPPCNNFVRLDINRETVDSKELRRTNGTVADTLSIHKELPNAKRQV